ncbi:hypothetical protein [Nocardia sp. NPDC058497]|uniref:hypothetical protein n=1 Tax=Nocardia sp. NPDC058497 TaxID=3346529 RepID=UPI003651BC5B
MILPEDNVGVPILRGTAVRWVCDDHTARGVVEVQFTDADGVVHSIVDKLPIFFGVDDDPLQQDSTYPTPCPVEVVIVEHLDGGRTTVDLRWSESITDQVRFVVRTADIAT